MADVFSGVHWSAYLAPSILVFSVLVASIGVFSARAIARKKATLDLIERFESTGHYIGLRSRFSHRRRGGGFTALNDPQDETAQADRQAVLDYLNHYEIVGIGIRKGILDAGVYRAWMAGALLRDWNAASDFIQRERWKFDAAKGSWRYSARVYENFQYLVRKWSPSEAANLTANGPPPPATPSGPGDEPLPRPVD